MKPCTLITCVYVTEDKACKSKLQFELCSHIIDVHQWRRSFILLTAFVSAAFSQQTTAYVTWATTTNPAGLWCKHISRVAYHHQNKPALMGGEQGVSVAAIPTSYGGRAQWASAECRVQVGAFLTRDSDPRQCLLLIFKQTFTARELLDHQGCRTATIKHMYHIRLRTYNIIFRAYFSVWLLFPKRTELFNKACSKVNATISE